MTCQLQQLINHEREHNKALNKPLILTTSQDISTHFTPKKPKVKLCMTYFARFYIYVCKRDKMWNLIKWMPEIHKILSNKAHYTWNTNRYTIL